MKTAIKTFIAAALALCAVSCDKEQMNNSGKSELVPIQFELDNVDGKTYITPDPDSPAGKTNFLVKFSDGDKISVFDGTNNCEFTAIVDGETGKVVFAGEANDVDTYYAAYPYNANASLEDGKIVGISIPAQQDAVAGTYDPKAGVSVAVSSVEGEVKKLSFKNIGALAEFIPNPEAGHPYAKAGLEGNHGQIVAGGSLSVDPVDASYELPAEGAKRVYLNGTFVAGNKYYIVLYPQSFDDSVGGTEGAKAFDGGVTLRAYSSSNDILAFLKTYQNTTFSKAGKKGFGILQPTVPVPAPLSGVFSVNAQGKKVRFAPGNLQYQASTKNWRFAEKQYISLRDTEEGGNTTVCLLDGSNNPIPSHDGEISRVDQSKWIDLYGYGCTGDRTITKLAQGYMPWEVYVAGSSSDKHYWNGPNLTVADHTDWGYVVSGTDELPYNPWFTLTEDEWNYLTGLDSSDSYISGLPETGSTYFAGAWHTPNGRVAHVADGQSTKGRTCMYIRVDLGDRKVKGLLLLPDVWEWPEAAGEEPVDCYNTPAGTRMGPDGKYVNGAGDAVNVKIYYPVAPNGRDKESAYTLAQFQALESAGAVFLPCTGFRKNAGTATGKNTGTAVGYPDDIGCYWSSSSLNYAASLGFYPSGDFTSTSKDMNSPRPPRCGNIYRANEIANYRDQGYAVRLVKEYVEE